MTGIIITSIICVSIIVIVGIFCYTSYKNDENSSSNKFYKTVTCTLNQYNTIIDEIINLKALINSMQDSIVFISMQISNKENKDE